MNLDQIQIARDQWGIPHIFGKTDQDVAYGLAIASCEDGFQTIQETLSLGNQCFGEIKGIKGLEYDYVTQLVELDKTVNKNYDKISKEFKEYLEAYCLGLNRYAHKHSKKVIAPSLFPVTPKKILKAAQVATMGFARVGDALSSMIHGGQKNHKRDLGGSNAFAFSKKIVEENETVLVINPHQPIKGFMRYYEFHLCSEEGLDVIGASLMGLPIVILGSNKNLAWALTRNYTDLYDTYKLKMHPSKKLYYDLDGEWRKLKKKKAPLSFKLFGFLPIKVSKAIYKSAHGPVAKGKDGFYALRMPAADEIRAPEQWFRMNKAQNYRDFKEALNMQAFASGNLIYADKDDNIYYLYNGLFAEKNEKYNWKDHLPGDVSEVIWPKEYLSLDKLPQVLNPPSGYVYNCNHTPYTSGEGIKESATFHKIGVQKTDNSRSKRVQKLIPEMLSAKGKLSFSDIETIKYDTQAPDSFFYEYVNLDGYKQLNLDDYPDLKDCSAFLNEPICASKKNEKAALWVLATEFLQDVLIKGEDIDYKNKVTDKQFAESLRKAKAYLLKHYGKILIPLEEVQILEKNNKQIPVSGMRGTLHHCVSDIRKDGKLEMIDGEAYLMYVRFKEEGLELSSVLPFGNSEESASVHCTDQMPLFSNHKTKSLLFDKTEILKQARRIYKPTEI